MNIRLTLTNIVLTLKRIFVFDKKIFPLATIICQLLQKVLFYDASIIEKYGTRRFDSVEGVLLTGVGGEKRKNGLFALLKPPVWENCRAERGMEWNGMERKEDDKVLRKIRRIDRYTKPHGPGALL